MNVWRDLVQAARGARSEPVDERRGQLPLVDAFAEISLNGSRRRESVAIDAVDARGIATRRMAGLATGDRADFLYTNDTGKYRFATVCVQLDERGAVFALPPQIKTIESFANRRAAPRVPWLGSAQWRFAPGGRGSGEYYPASMMDLSSGGSALVVGQALKPGMQVELRFRLAAAGEPVTALSHVVRATKIEASEKSAAALQFVDVDQELQRMLSEFVSEQQAVRRERGVV